MMETALSHFPSCNLCVLLPLWIGLNNHPPPNGLAPFRFPTRLSRKVIVLKKIFKVDFHIRSQFRHHTLDPSHHSFEYFPKRRITLSFSHHHLNSGLGFPDHKPQPSRNLLNVA